MVVLVFLATLLCLECLVSPQIVLLLSSWLSSPFWGKERLRFLDYLDWVDWCSAFICMFPFTRCYILLPDKSLGCHQCFIWELQLPQFAVHWVQILYPFNPFPHHFQKWRTLQSSGSFHCYCIPYFLWHLYFFFPRYFFA